MSDYSLRRAGEDGRTRLIGAMVAFAMVFGLVMVGAVAQAVHDIDTFELDKNATNNLSVTAVGYLNSNINATATSIDVCQTGTAAAGGDLILIRAERMQVTANAAGSFGGNCPGTKRTYTVVRGVSGTTAAAQSGGANNIGARVSLLSAGDDTTKPGVDWTQVHTAWLNDPATTCGSLGLVECTFIPDGIGPTTFIGGNTKDHLPVSGWAHTSGASPDKGEILNAFAAKAIDGDDQILYFGMDRYAVDGSTDIGFWFFQAEVGLNDDGSFTGNQTEGDVLILATFTQGGAATNLRVFEWVESGGSEQANIDGPDTYGDCVGGPANDGGCATVNNTTIEVPWTYTFKGASVGKWIPAGGFFEGGINLTDAGLDGCFSSFMAETRSSPEITAVLKDFALGDFEACDSGLVTTPSDGAGTALVDSNTNSIPDIVIGTGSAGVDVKDSAVLDIKGTNTWAGTLEFYLCGPLAAPATCSTGGVPIGSAINVASTDSSYTYLSASANLTSVGRYCWRGEFDSSTEGVPDAKDDSLGECFEVLPVTPTLSTQVVDSNGAILNPATVSFGQAVYDRATLSGTANSPGTNGGESGAYTSINATNGQPAGGSIVFTLVGPGDCTTVATGTGTNPGSAVTVSGDDNYLSAGFTPGTPGAYSWKASYSGDSPNTSSRSHNGDCSDTNEDVTVQQLQPTMTTAQRFVPNDAATITVGGGGDLAGSVVFQLFVNDATCAGTAAYTSGSIDITTGTGTGTSKTVMSSNTTAYSTSETTFHWVVTYTSTNTAHLGVTSACGNEHSSITIDNGLQQPQAGS